MRILLFCLLLTTISRGATVKIFKFTDNREDGTGASIASSKPTVVGDFSFCLDFEVTLIKDFRIISTQNSNDLEILIPNSLDHIQVGFKEIWFLAYTDQVEPYNWGTFCLSYNKVTHNISFAYKGKIIFSKNDPQNLGPRTIADDFLRSLVLGDKSAGTTYSGSMANFRVWSQPFSQEVLRKISMCDGPIVFDVVPDLVNWESSDWDLTGDIEEREADIYPCEKVDTDVFDLLMPKAASNFQGAYETCVALGGIMPLPKNEKEMEYLKNIAMSNLDKSSCVSYLWMPIRQSELNEELWYTEEEYQEETPPPWLVWEAGQPNGQDRQTCTTVGLAQSSTNFLFDDSCSVDKYCYMCKFEDITFFKFRGLCENLQEKIDRRYLIDTEILMNNLQKGIVWTGFKKSRIMLDAVTNRWKVTSLFSEDPIITLANEKDLPTGVTQWNVPEGICGDESTKRTLFLNSCNFTEFACHDGDCVPIKARCNGENDCPDESDEQDCQTLYWEGGNKDAYSEAIPPRPLDEDITPKLLVYVNATVKGLIAIKELEGIWQSKVSFEVTWLDQRLFMQNLKENDNLNILKDLERKELWIPEIIFGNNDEEERMVLDEKALLIVNRKEKEGFPSTHRDLDAAEIFLGELNPILYRRTYSSKFDCNYNLESYPFDTQECKMELMVPPSLTDLVELVAQNITYLGPTKLAQFEIIKSTFHNEDGVAIFIMIFRRRFANQLVTVYIPSMCLLGITIITSYIETEHFEANIMVYLTTMLVMYTLFQAIATSLPQTAYLKLVDLWLFFGLVLPFLAFVLEVLEEIIEERQESDEKNKTVNHVKVRLSAGGSSVSPEKMSLIEDNSDVWAGRRRIIRFIARVFLPIFTVIFVIGYTIFAVYSYANPTLEFD